MKKLSIMEKIEALKAIGCNRGIYTQEWYKSYCIIQEWATEIGLETKTDCLGNIFCRLKGLDNSKTVALISHFDTVKNGGAYDGVVGIVGGLEVLRQLKEENIMPDISIELIAICDEEGSRFKTTFLGSRGIVGGLQIDELENAVDEENISFLQSRMNSGFNSITTKDLLECKRKDIIKSLELHVEQSSFLYNTAIPIGIATSIPGQIKIKMTVIGVANHAGTTNMIERKDALCGAAKIISFVEELGIKYNGITTVGYSMNLRNATNVIPSRVELIADLRHHDLKTFNRMIDDLQDYTLVLEDKRGIEIQFEKLVKIDPVETDLEISNIIKRNAKKLDYKFLEIKSGAGHDTQIFANNSIKTGLIFIPSEKGLSHCPEEFTKDEYIEYGVKLLYYVTKKLAYL